MPTDKLLHQAENNNQPQAVGTTEIRTMLPVPRGAMDKIISHILAGVMLSGLGLWHLFNHIRLFVSLAPTSPSSSYVAPAWFPAPRVRHLELIVMLVGGVYGFVTQMLAYSPMPFHADGSIPPERLPNHEHAIIYASLIIYAGSAMYLDRNRAGDRRGHPTLCMLLLATLYAQELFVFHVHSTDHAGVEGRLHWFLQAAAAVCLATTLLGAGRLPAELQFVVSLVRSASLAFQGLWGFVIGVAWIPGMAPKGCSLDDGGVNLLCHGDDSLHYAVAVVNLQFGWCMVLMAVLILGIYVQTCKRYPSGSASGEATTTYVYGRLPEVEADAAYENDEHHNTKTHSCKQAAVHDVHEFTSMEIEV